HLSEHQRRLINPFKNRELDIELNPASGEAQANPPTHMIAVYSSRRIPVVPFRLPVPAAFPLLYSYLYTKRADVLLASLTPEHEQDIASLTLLAALIQGLWQNTCVLGVVDSVLYNTLDDAWCHIMSLLEKAQS
ncbi:hypothetical protein F5887DRAFT_982519, partial [Amanita rubescens]